MSSNIYRLKEVMKEKGMQGKDLADKVGVSANSISNIATGATQPKPELILKIAEVLNVDLRELFISTKGGQPSSDEVEKAVALIKEGVSLLEKK